MEAGAVNVPYRVQLSRRRGWRMPPHTVSVARPSRWGNPYRIGPNYDAFACVRQFRISCESGEILDMAEDGVGSMPVSVEQWLAPLRGKNLACWCPIGTPCHADVLLELATR